VAVLSASLFGVVAQANAGASFSGQAEFEYVTVAAGETLWSIAQEHAIGDARDYMANLISLNALTTAELTPGQRIALPR
jgi:LysM repeat protein